MKVIASAAMSMDGYIDDVSPQRLILSGAEDLEEVRKLRAECDAILVGAETVRRDNPSLVTHGSVLKEMRKAKGQYEDPIKVTVTNNGDIDIQSNFFQKGNCPKIVITGNKMEVKNIHKLREVSKLIQLPVTRVTAKAILKALEREGISTLLVEGGSAIFSMFFRENVINEFRLAIAPFFVGETSAPRLVSDGIYPFTKNNRMVLTSVKKSGDVAVLYYSMNDVL